MSATAPSPTRYDRAAAWALLTKWTQSESLRKRCPGCGNLRRGLWRNGSRAGAGTDRRRTRRPAHALLHHCPSSTISITSAIPRWTRTSVRRSVRELTRLGWPQATQTAILGHATYSGVPRETHLDKVLFACDELSGFLTACALVKPSKAIADVELTSVRKKLKDKAFARGVNRRDVIQGAEELGVELDAHIAFCLAAMQRRAAELGL